MQSFPELLVRFLGYIPSSLPTGCHSNNLIQRRRRTLQEDIGSILTGISHARRLNRCIHKHSVSLAFLVFTPNHVVTKTNESCLELIVLKVCLNFLSTQTDEQKGTQLLQKYQGFYTLLITQTYYTYPLSELGIVLAQKMYLSLHTYQYFLAAKEEVSVKRAAVSTHYLR